MVRLFSLLNLSQCSISGGEVTLWVKLVTFTTCAQCRLVLQHRTCRSVVLTDATGPSPANLRALTAFPVYSRWLTLGDGHVVNKPKIVVQPESTPGAVIARSFDGSHGVMRPRGNRRSRRMTLKPLTNSRRWVGVFVTCFVAPGNSPRCEGRPCERWSMWCRSKPVSNCCC